jgi:hypothetical protein
MTTLAAPPGARDRAQDFNQTVKVAWTLIHLARVQLADIEERANAVLAVIIAAMLAIWATINDFDPGPTRAAVYAGWGIVVLSVFIHGVSIFPRQEHALARFLQPGFPFTSRKALSIWDQCELACLVSAGIDREARRLRRSIRWSIGLNLLALGVIAGAYVAETI